ncbi:MAG: VWA domain-containing protein [Myxococcota bacterium]
MTLVLPQALLLLVPLWLWVWKRGRVNGPAFVLRFATVGVLVLALAQPHLSWRSAGSDLMVVVDRSRSMPPGSEGKAEELIRLLEAQRRPGDRLGVVAFGREARVEAALSEQTSFGGFSRAVDAEASDLASALDAAGELVPSTRAARVLVISDGRATGLDVRGAARRLAARGIAVDYRWLGREESRLDLAVVALDGPSAVSVKEPFLLSATVHASAAAKGTVLLERNGQPLVKGPYDFRAGQNVLTFRDWVEEEGLVSYRLTVEAAGDTVVENDVGRAVLRVEGPPRVLLLTHAPEGTLAKTLAESGLRVEVRAPFPLTMDALDGVGTVVLENVEAGSLSEAGLHVLAQYVKEAGGGLVMTGGKMSFGEGGFRKSPVEELLPVSLEVREEQRRAAVAMAIIMDCSCSMGATVSDGRTKMELAAEGVVGALELLNDHDEASVHMVDTQAHEIFGLAPVSEGLPLGKVARGFSGGGGIYVGVGLAAGRDEILQSRKPTRHLLLFSDAADSEEPGDYLRTLSELQREKVTVSVIGLGRRTDPDGALLEEIALRGGGRVYFAEDATSLPRIFSQETIAVARATFVDTQTAAKLGPDLALLGQSFGTRFSSVGGYNLSYLRPRASVGLRTSDENEAPLLALWPKGAGKVVAYTGEVDGEFTGPMRHFGGYRALLEQMVRWTMPPHADSIDVVPRAIRWGNDLHVTLDFDPKSAPPEGAATLVLLTADARTAPVELPLRWEDEDRMGVHYSLPGSGTFHPVVKLEGRVLRAPPVTLPYAPEFEPSSVADGRQLLAAIAKASGGVERLAMTHLFADAVESVAFIPLAPLLVAGALALLLAEVITRRFFQSTPLPLGEGKGEGRVHQMGADTPHPAPLPEGEEVEPRSPFEVARERAKQRLRR